MSADDLYSWHKPHVSYPPQHPQPVDILVIWSTASPSYKLQEDSSISILHVTHKRLLIHIYRMKKKTLNFREQKELLEIKDMTTEMKI